MIKLTSLNILGQSNAILNLKKGFDETVKNISTVSEDLLMITLKMYENGADNLSNNL